MTKTYRIEVFEEPWMNDSEFLHVNGKEFTFHDMKMVKYLMGELCNAYKEDFNQEYADDFWLVYRSDDDENILYYISDVKQEPFANHHGRHTTPSQLKHAYLTDKKALKARKTQPKKDSIASLKNAYKKML